MFRTSLIMLALATVSAPALAQDAGNWQCNYDDLVRRLAIVYEPGRAVPCEVHYYKDVEMPGEREVLWRAQNEAGYCEARVEELVARLESQGWSCAAGDPASAADPDTDDAEEEAPADDTDALAPAHDEQ